MKRPATMCLAMICVFAFAGTAAAQSVGGGISVFVPLTMFEDQEGSVGFETSAETAMGLGPIFSVPLGISYNQVWGLRPAGTLANDDDFEASGPWFYSDSLLTYLMLKAHVPLGPLYLDLFGGGAMNWNIALRPLHNRIAGDLEEAGRLVDAGDNPATGTAAVHDLNVTDGAIGWGWVAGAGLGVQIGQIGVDVNATYRQVRHNLRIEGDWFDSNGNRGDFDTDDEALFDEFIVLLQGFAIGISGNYAM